MLYKSLVRLRSAILVFLTHSMALPVLKLIRKPEIFPYTREDLSCFSKGSLGNDLVNFIDEKQITLLPYYARHDIKHILLEYDTTDDGEACLQCFMLGNGHVSFPVIATVMYGCLTMPEHWGLFRVAYRRGKNSPSLEDWKWFEILRSPTHKLQRLINNCGS